MNIPAETFTLIDVEDLEVVEKVWYDFCKYDLETLKGYIKTIYAHYIDAETTSKVNVGCDFKTLAEDTGVSELELKQAHFLRLANGGDISPYVCKTVEELDALGKKTFGNAWDTSGCFTYPNGDNGIEYAPGKYLGTVKHPLIYPECLCGDLRTHAHDILVATVLAVGEHKYRSRTGDYAGLDDGHRVFYFIYLLRIFKLLEAEGYSTTMHDHVGFIRVDMLLDMGDGTDVRSHVWFDLGRYLAKKIDTPEGWECFREFTKLCIFRNDVPDTILDNIIIPYARGTLKDACLSCGPRTTSTGYVTLFPLSPLADPFRIWFSEKLAFEGVTRFVSTTCLNSSSSSISGSALTSNCIPLAQLYMSAPFTFTTIRNLVKHSGLPTGLNYSSLHTAMKYTSTLLFSICDTDKSLTDEGRFNIIPGSKVFVTEDCVISALTNLGVEYYIGFRDSSQKVPLKLYVTNKTDYIDLLKRCEALGVSEEQNKVILLDSNSDEDREFEKSASELGSGGCGSPIMTYDEFFEEIVRSTVYFSIGYLGGLAEKEARLGEVPIISRDVDGLITEKSSAEGVLFTTINDRTAYFYIMPDGEHIQSLILAEKDVLCNDYMGTDEELAIHTFMSNKSGLMFAPIQIHCGGGHYLLTGKMPVWVDGKHHKARYVRWANISRKYPNLWEYVNTLPKGELLKLYKRFYVAYTTGTAERWVWSLGGENDK